VSNIEISALAASQWCAQLGASVLPMSPSANTPLGSISVSGTGLGTGPRAIAMRASRRPWTEVAFAGVRVPDGGNAAALAPAGVPAMAQGADQLGQQANNQTHIEKQYLTSVSADGAGAAGPPRRRGSA
jgi:hypothetical protein